jgi:hypothetical protein
MTLCPNKHDNPLTLTICQTCGLPVLDIAHEAEMVTNIIRSKSTLTRPKMSSDLVGVGPFGAGILAKVKNSNNAQKGSRLAYISVDNIDAENKALEDGSSFLVALGQDTMGSTFCGRAENIAKLNPSLMSVLRRTGFRDSDENQSILLTLAMGEGTGSGVSHVLLERARMLNPKCFNYVLGLLPSVTDSIHGQINAFYGLASLLQAGSDGNLSDAVILIQYDRLKQLRGVGSTGEELKMEDLVAVLFRLMASTLTGPGISKIGTLLRWNRDPVLVPCLAVGRSLEIFGSLSNILESSIAYPLCQISRENISSSYLLLNVPRRLAKIFPENEINDEFAGFSHKYFPNIGSIGYQLTYSDDQHDRLDACLLLGGDNSVLSTIIAAYEKFKQGAKTANDLEIYGLTKERIPDAERTLANYCK